MPVLESINYKPPFYFRYGHFATIYPSLFRNVKDVEFERKRWTTPDGDFLDLDWSRVGSKNLIISLHGLEGSSDSNYIKGVIKIFNQNKWDGVAMNFRGCSGEPNLLRRGYHSGETTDLDFIVKTIAEQYDYEKIVIVGFSLGGNVVLKYGGEQGENLHPKVKKLIAISVPIDLAGCTVEIEKKNNFIYLNRFLISLKNKFKLKQHLYPDIDAQKVFNAKTFKDIDGALTAPIHGFESAEDYWYKSSSLFFIADITIPTLIINAHDDSFLSEKSYPYELAHKHSNIHLITPKYGGHVGFPQSHPKGYYWSEERIIDFVEGTL